MKPRFQIISRRNVCGAPRTSRPDALASDARYCTRLRGASDFTHTIVRDSHLDRMSLGICTGADCADGHGADSGPKAFVCAKMQMNIRGNDDFHQASRLRTRAQRLAAGAAASRFVISATMEAVSDLTYPALQGGGTGDDPASI